MQTLVFLCIENSCRSQIAQAFAKKYGEGKVNALSAGSHPSGRINEKAVLLMKEYDYDLNSHSSTGTNDLPEGEVHSMISMGCGDSCPTIKAKNRIEWNIPDPKNMELDEFREVIKEIENRVLGLLETI